MGTQHEGLRYNIYIIHITYWVGEKILQIFRVNFKQEIDI